MVRATLSDKRQFAVSTIPSSPPAHSDLTFMARRRALFALAISRALFLCSSSRSDHQIWRKMERVLQVWGWSSRGIFESDDSHVIYLSSSMRHRNHRRSGRYQNKKKFYAGTCVGWKAPSSELYTHKRRSPELACHDHTSLLYFRACDIINIRSDVTWIAFFAQLAFRAHATASSIFGYTLPILNSRRSKWSINERRN